MTTEPLDATTPDAPTSKPLEGVKVVEISIYIQGPVAGMALAALGADVIRIEAVGKGEPFRTLESFYGVNLADHPLWAFAATNRGKRSIALDVASDSGREVFHRLIAGADAFVTNLRPDSIAAMGADYETLKQVNPRLVYGMSNGLGFDGPYAGMRVQDTVGSAYAGFMDVTSETDVPTYPPGAMSDTLTASFLASAILAGLVRRSITGTGSVVRASQLQSLIWMEMMSVGLTATSGRRLDRFSARANPFLAPYRTADGWIAIAAIHPHQWQPMADALELSNLPSDPRFSDFGVAMASGEVLAPILQEQLLTKTTEEWWGALRKVGVWSGPVNRIEDLPSDVQVHANGYLLEYDDGIVAPPVPFDVGGWRGDQSAAAAEYGQHTDEVLSELELTPEEIVALRVEGAIW